MSVDPTALVERYFKWAQDIARRLGGRRARKRGGYTDREECESIALESLWKAARKYNPEKGSFKPYAQRVIIHDVMAAGRHKERSEEIAPEEWAGLVDPHKGPLEAVVTEEGKDLLRDRVSEALDQLPCWEKYIMHCLYFRKMLMQDIACNMVVSIRTAQRLRASAEEKLRDLVE